MIPYCSIYQPIVIHFFMSVSLAITEKAHTLRVSYLRYYHEDI